MNEIRWRVEFYRGEELLDEYKMTTEQVRTLNDLRMHIKPDRTYRIFATDGTEVEVTNNGSIVQK